jgi:hypothetical protein
MKKPLLATAAVAALVASVASASSSELPACNSATVVETLASAIRPSFIVDVEDYEKVGPAAKKRWCYTYFSSTRLPNGGYRMGSPWQEAIYTVEWTNEAEGRYWLQVVEQAVHRRYGNSWDYDQVKLKDGKWVPTHPVDPPPLKAPVKGEIIDHTCTFKPDGRRETVSVEVLPYVADYTVKFISKAFKPGDQASCQSMG